VDELIRSILAGGPQPWPERMDADGVRRFVERAEYHGVVPLLHDRLYEPVGRRQVPGGLAAELDRRTKWHAAIEMSRAHDLRMLKDELDAAGVRALLLKGAALAYTHYAKPYMRLGVDMDFLVGLDAIETTRRVFEVAGFGVMHTRYKSHQFGCARAGPGGVSLAYDVHWRASNLARFARVLTFEDAWRGAATIGELNGWRTLGPVHQLMLSCMHRAANPRHDPNRLIWLYDVHMLLESLSEAESRQFGEQARAARIQHVCADALRAAARALGTVYPPDLESLLSAPAARRSLSRVFADSQAGLLADDLRHLPGLKARSRLVQELLLPPGEELLERFGKQARAWLPLLYVRYLVGGLWRRLTLN